MVKTYPAFIGGKWVVSGSGKTFEKRNPATGELIARFQECDREDVRKAVKSAQEAFPGWKATPAPERAELLLRAALALEKRKEEFARLMTEENGKVLVESRGDIQEAIDMFKYMAGEGRRLFGETTPSELRNKFCMTIREPKGVVGLITPWNFPMAIPAWKIAPALVCGNTIVFKPASDTPASAIKLVEVLEDSGLPPGVLNLVTGPGSIVGAEITENPGICHISFTGSTEVGQSVYVSGAKKLNSVELEMGGKNPQIVLADADLDLAVQGAVWGAFGTSGQRCTATSRIIVEKPVLQKFTKRFLEKVGKLRTGNGLEKGMNMGPVINESQMKKILGYIERGKREGAKLLLGGRRLAGKDHSKGFFIAPTVFGGVKPYMTIAREEIFGPVVCIIEAKDFDHAVQIANFVEYGLSWSIYTRDINKAFRAMRLAESGLFYVNAPTIGAEVHLPFGGIKGTGNGGREAGTAAIEEFSEIKSVFIDYSGGLQRAQIDNK
jgi:aldehyde dehydrogenase (NAD+)